MSQRACPFHALADLAAYQIQPDIIERRADMDAACFEEALQRRAITTGGRQKAAAWRWSFSRW